jgi:hypothetical protein
MPTVGFELTISPGERLQAYALDLPAYATREEERLLIQNIGMFLITSLYAQF